MRLLTFKGGIHPNDGKSLSKDQPIKELLPGNELAYPLSQHIGAPAVAIVKKGDYVLKGQKIAEAGGFVSSPVYASVSGTVKGIEKRFNPAGTKTDCVIVENDHTYTEVEYSTVKSFEDLSKEEIIKKIQDAGVVGMGGAGFPTHVKLSPKDADKIEYIIANGAECEPYLTADYRCMLENTEEIVSGMRIVLSLFKNAKAIFGVEDNKMDCVAKLQEAIKNEPRMEVMSLQTKYPQGAERQLIYALTKRALNSSMLPADAGCIVDNVETFGSIHRAVMEGKPLIERVVTVSGDAVACPANYRVLLGTNHRELIEEAGGLKEWPEKIISGGPMMGFAMPVLDVPVTKTSSGILAFLQDEPSKRRITDRYP